MLKKVNSPILFILIGFYIILSGFSGCKPLISQQPVNAEVAVGGIGMFSVEATGVETMDYQWEKLDITPGSTWTAISGAVYSYLIIPAVTLTDNEMKFRCTVTNKYGQSLTNEVTLSVLRRIYVNAGATGGNNGTSWASAYTDLQDALARAGEGFEIWVAAGTYKPTDDEDISISFELKEGVFLYGGFSGAEKALNDRNWNTNLTILSGYLDAGYNSRHVVLGANNATINGFTISDGLLFPEGGEMGSGMYNKDCSPVITNCVFTGNESFMGGSGIYNENSNAVITSCTFTDNYTEHWGGGIYNYNSSPLILDCSFISNTADVGGGLVNDSSNPEIRNCLITGHMTDTGGGMYNLDSNSLIINCDIRHNSAREGTGGGIANSGGTTRIINSVFFSNFGYPGYAAGGVFSGGGETHIINCSFAKNTSNSFLGGGAAAVNGNNFDIVNSIFWDDVDEDHVEFYLTDSLVSYCLIKNTDLTGTEFDGGNNIYDISPDFIDETNGDLRLNNGSPSIDKGLDSIISGIPTDLSGAPRIAGATVDMGAFEHQD